MHDQAQGLRTLNQPKPVRVIAVTSGKGGVGKSSVSVNLSLSMIQAGQRVMLMDADLGLANVDVLLGLQPVYNLSHVLSGECSLEQTLLEGPLGLQIVPASSGQKHMSELSTTENAGLIRAFSELNRQLDCLVVDTAAGIADSVVTFAQASQEVVVVVCNEPASLTDAYALIKVMSRDHGVSRFQVLANMTRSGAEGRELFTKLSRVAERFLDVTLNYAGNIPYDDWMRRSIQRQRAVVEAFPSSPSASAFRRLAARAQGWTVPQGARGNLEFFVERLVGGGGNSAVGAVA